MKRIAKGYGFAAIAACFVLLLCSSPVLAQNTQGNCHDLIVPFQPMAFPSDGQYNVVYEVAISPSLSPALDVQSVLVYFDDKLAHVFDGAKLLEDQESPIANLRLAQGNRPQSYLLFWFSFKTKQDVPQRYRHRITFSGRQSTNGQTGPPVVVEGGETWILDQEPVVIEPPVKGAWNCALETTANFVHHRQGLITIDGVTRIGQRYAVDWVRLNDKGELFTGDGRELSDYPCYGDNIYAVADGVVLEVLDGIPDNAHPPERDYPITMDNVGGNLIVQDIGQGRYAGYAHFIPNTITVKKGDFVTTGQLLGKMGNSGNSDCPHLHFQICDGPSLLASQGLPYVHPRFESYGWYDLYYTMTFYPAEPKVHEYQMPFFEAVVTLE